MGFQATGAPAACAEAICQHSCVALAQKKNPQSKRARWNENVHQHPDSGLAQSLKKQIPVTTEVVTFTLSAVCAEVACSTTMNCAHVLNMLAPKHLPSLICLHGYQDNIVFRRTWTCLMKIREKYDNVGPAWRDLFAWPLAHYLKLKIKRQVIWC